MNAFLLVGLIKYSKRLILQVMSHEPQNLKNYGEYACVRFAVNDMNFIENQ